MSNSTADVFEDFSDPRAVLIRRILAVPERKKQFEGYMAKFLDAICNDKICSNVANRVLTLQQFLYKIVEVSSSFFTSNLLSKISSFDWIIIAI
jgi:hypothetical protein